MLKRENSVASISDALISFYTNRVAERVLPSFPNPQENLGSLASAVSKSTVEGPVIYSPVVLLTQEGVLFFWEKDQYAACFKQLLGQQNISFSIVRPLAVPTDVLKASGIPENRYQQCVRIHVRHIDARKLFQWMNPSFEECTAQMNRWYEESRLNRGRGQCLIEDCAKDNLQKNSLSPLVVASDIKIISSAEVADNQTGVVLSLQKTQISVTPDATGFIGIQWVDMEGNLHCESSELSFSTDYPCALEWSLPKDATVLDILVYSEDAVAEGMQQQTRWCIARFNCDIPAFGVDPAAAILDGEAKEAVVPFSYFTSVPLDQANDLLIDQVLDSIHGRGSSLEKPQSAEDRAQQFHNAKIMLTRCPALINQQDSRHGATPLMGALFELRAYIQHVDRTPPELNALVDFIIAHPIFDPLVVNRTQNTALHSAAWSHHVEVCHKLIRVVKEKNLLKQLKYVMNQLNETVFHNICNAITRKNDEPRYILQQNMGEFSEENVINDDTEDSVLDRLYANPSLCNQQVMTNGNTALMQLIDLLQDSNVSDPEKAMIRFTVLQILRDKGDQIDLIAANFGNYMLLSYALNANECEIAMAVLQCAHAQGNSHFIVTARNGFREAPYKKIAEFLIKSMWACHVACQKQARATNQSELATYQALVASSRQLVSLADDSGSAASADFFNWDAIKGIHQFRERDIAQVLLRLFTRELSIDPSVRSDFLLHADQVAREWTGKNTVIPPQISSNASTLFAGGQQALPDSALVEKEREKQRGDLAPQHRTLH